MIHDYGKLIFNTFFQKDTNALLDKILLWIITCLNLYVLIAEVLYQYC